MENQSPLRKKKIPVWVQISFVLGVVFSIISTVLLVFGYLSYDDYSYAPILGIIPLVLSTLHKDSWVLTERQNELYDKTILSWREVFILLGTSTVLAFLIRLLSVHFSIIDTRSAFGALFAFNGIFAFFFMGRRDSEFAQELGSKVGAIRGILGVVLALIGMMVAFGVNVLLCVTNHCAW